MAGEGGSEPGSSPLQPDADGQHVQGPREPAQQGPHEALDAFGFSLEVTSEQAGILERCRARQEHVRAKWQAAARGPNGLPLPDVLKKLCRKVGGRQQPDAIVLPHPSVPSAHRQGLRQRASQRELLVAQDAPCDVPPSCRSFPACLQGVPPDLRRQMWLQLSGANVRRQQLPPHYYANSALQGGSSPFAHQIELVRARCLVLQRQPANGWVQLVPCLPCALTWRIVTCWNAWHRYTQRLVCRMCRAPFPTMIGCKARLGKVPCGTCCVRLRTTTRVWASEWGAASGGLGGHVVQTALRCRACLPAFSPGCLVRIARLAPLLPTFLAAASR